MCIPLACSKKYDENLLIVFGNIVSSKSNSNYKLIKFL